MLNFEFLKSRGLKAWIDGNKLKIAPPEKVTPELAAYIREHKKAIMFELKSVIYRNPYPQGTREAREESLLQVMGAMYQVACKKAQEAYETGELIPDRRIKAVHQAVLKGQAKLKDFQAAIDKTYLN